MRYIEFLGERVSVLGYGCMRFPTIEVDGKAVIDEDKSIPLIDRAMQAGVNYYDTAYFYHNNLSEVFMGKALSKYPRDTYYLATKMPCSMIKSLDQAKDIFEEQFVKCGVEYFDFYLMHALDKESFDRNYSLGVYDYLVEQQKLGRIKHFGFSFHDTPAVLEYILDTAKFEFCQLQYNYLDYSVQRADLQWEIANSRGLKVIVMEPLRGGTLVNLPKEAREEMTSHTTTYTPAQWGMRYCMTTEGVLTVLSGMTTMEQLEDNIRTASTLSPLSTSDYDMLERVVEKFTSVPLVPCTGCGYCMKKCLRGVYIPDIFRDYNEYVLGGDKDKYLDSLKSLRQDLHYANRCVYCHSCEAICPQHIEISSLLRRIQAGAYRITEEDRYI